MTSEITSTTDLLWPSDAASRPPLTFDKCFRTAFISWMFAPERINNSLTARFDSKDRPEAGETNNAEEPPESATSRKDSVGRDLIHCNNFSVAWMLCSSGIGWEPFPTSDSP